MKTPFIMALQYRPNWNVNPNNWELVALLYLVSLKAFNEAAFSNVAKAEISFTSSSGIDSTSSDSTSFCKLLGKGVICFLIQFLMFCSEIFPTLISLINKTTSPISLSGIQSWNLFARRNVSAAWNAVILLWLENPLATERHRRWWAVMSINLSTNTKASFLSIVVSRQ